MTNLKPWAHGPFELIKHAEGHLKAGTDFDKRMALISFDNAIEVTISSYLRLHPMQREGKTYAKNDVERWLRSYHSKLEFLESHLSGENQSIGITMVEIAWYHDLRNELYHSGNGFVPEERHLNGIRQAALKIFSILYRIDAEGLLKKDTPPPKPVKDVEALEQSEAMQFLQTFIRFEKALSGPEKRYLWAFPPEKSDTPPTIRRAWELFTREYGNVPETYHYTIREAIEVRNSIVHGSPLALNRDRLEKLRLKLAMLLEFLEKSRSERGSEQLPDDENDSLH